MKPLYFAPLNHFSSAAYREFMLSLGADFVFSELIMVDRIDDEFSQGKFEVYGDGLSKTIFQIGARSPEEVCKGVSFIKSIHAGVCEINLNAGCPQSSMQKSFVCSGLLFDKEIFFSVVRKLVLECERVGCLPSVKTRLGTSPDDVDVRSYLDLFVRAGIKKVYLHARTLRYNYTHPAFYEHLRGLKDDYPGLELIFNGDVDSFARYSELVSLGADGVMVGRAALTNHEVFLQIKNGDSVKSSRFDPVTNDPLIDFSLGFAKPTFKKKELLLRFLDLSIEHDLSLSLIKKHLLFATKGLGGRKELTASIRDSISVDDLKTIILSL